MEKQICSKCGGEMDSGSISSEQSLIYVSDAQKGLFKIGTPVNRANACLDCGHIELRLDARLLRQKIT